MFCLQVDECIRIIYFTCKIELTNQQSLLQPSFYHNIIIYSVLLATTTTLYLVCDKGHCMTLFLCKGACLLRYSQGLTLGLQFLDNKAALLIAVSHTKLSLQPLYHLNSSLFLASHVHAVFYSVAQMRQFIFNT